MTPAPLAVATSAFTADELTKRTTLTTTQTWTFDAAGSAIHDTLFVNGFSTRTRDYAWDAAGRFAKSTTNGASTEYFYTGDGEISHVVGPGEAASTEDLLQWGEWARCDRASGGCKDRVIVNDEVIAEYDGNTFEMPHRTVNGTIAAVSNDAGQIIRQEEFRPYGARSLGTGAGAFEQHFQGMRADKVIVAGGRGYDPEAGTWLSRDSYVLANPEQIISTPQLGSMYAFDFGNPYRWRDPSGHAPETGIPLVDVALTVVEDGPEFVEEGEELVADHIGEIEDGIKEGTDFVENEVKEGATALAEPLDNLATNFQKVGSTIKDTQNLQKAASDGIAKAMQAGLTPAQQNVAARIPGLNNAFWGSNFDKWFKLEVLGNSELSHLNVTGLFKMGPDVYNAATGVWWDLTRMGQWAAHVSQYTPSFGHGIPLFW